ncbi:MAG TPA: hypothetical protein VEM32_11465, partial [Geobacteraceae bacterium]|nr:hypothetical protein [Geobacteraceae bacterium]
PRWKRAAWRTGGTMFLPLLALYAILADSRVFLLTGAVIMIGLIFLAARKLRRVARLRNINREWLVPLHEALAPKAGVPLSVRPSSWLAVDRGRQRAEIRLPAGYNDNERQRELLVATAARKLGMEDPDPKWQLAGKEPSLVLIASDDPPGSVRLADIRSAVVRAPDNVLVLGLGKKSLPVDVSLHTDSPHAGASMGAGAGKSTLARFVAAQALHKGAVILFLDIKKISHMWARGLPNVLYADTPALIHSALIWLGSELDRRNDVALFSSDVEGNVTAEVGSRLIIIAEELNLTANRLRAYWKDVLNGTGTSPAFLALQDVAFAGRQVNMNMFAIGQMLTARVMGASGGNEARENVGIRILARYTKKTGTCSCRSTRCLSRAGFWAACRLSPAGSRGQPRSLTSPGRKPANLPWMGTWHCCHMMFPRNWQFIRLHQ